MLARWLSNSTNLTLGAAVVRLAAALVLFWPVLAAFAYAAHGLDGALAASLAVATCGVGACLALLATALTSSPQRALFAICYAMFLGGGVPFAVGLIVSRVGGPLADAGLFGLSIAGFEFTLVVQTWLLLRLVHRPLHAASSSGAHLASLSTPNPPGSLPS